ncbi:MAG: aminotransferase DegT [Candidatus Aenigmatarchaeota archaeon]|nr:MAG: aminotransferase DegT [Candidatus Aenigmarchaeota archaeon]
MIPIAKPTIGEEEVGAVSEIIKSGNMASGKQVKKFEEEFAEYSEVKESIATVNGTVSLDLALKALNIKPDDEVILPDFSFIATANCVLFQNAKPVFADVDKKTFNIDAEDIKKKITPNTKAIIGVHLFGQPFEIEKIKEICKNNDLYLIEDCAQAHGAEYKNKKVGSFGDIGCFSLYATKNMTSGEGGILTTNNKVLGGKLRLLINHGQTEKYLHSELGYNYRMTNIQAGLGLCQLKKLDDFNKKRIDNACYLSENIKVSGLTLPYIKRNIKHVFHQYVVRIEDNFCMNRVEFIKYLNENGIGCAIHYPLPISKQPIYQKLGYSPQDCPVAAEVAEKVLSLPVHPSLIKEDLKHIVKTINKL